MSRMVQLGDLPSPICCPACTGSDLDPRDYSHVTQIGGLSCACPIVTALICKRCGAAALTDAQLEWCERFAATQTLKNGYRTGAVVRDVRRIVDMDQAQFAVALNRTLATIVSWETGGSWPDVAALRDLIALLGRESES